MDFTYQIICFLLLTLFISTCPLISNYVYLIVCMIVSWDKCLLLVFSCLIVKAISTMNYPHISAYVPILQFYMKCSPLIFKWSEFIVLTFHFLYFPLRWRTQSPSLGSGILFVWRWKVSLILLLLNQTLLHLHLWQWSICHLWVCVYLRYQWNNLGIWFVRCWQWFGP